MKLSLSVISIKSSTVAMDHGQETSSFRCIHDFSFISTQKTMPKKIRTRYCSYPSHLNCRISLMQFMSMMIRCSARTGLILLLLLLLTSFIVYLNCTFICNIQYYHRGTIELWKGELHRSSSRSIM